MFILGLVFIILSCTIGASYILAFLGFIAMPFLSIGMNVYDKFKENYKGVRHQKNMKDPNYAKAQEVVDKMDEKKKETFFDPVRKVTYNNGIYTIHLEYNDDVLQRQFFTKLMKDMNINSSNYKFIKE